ncbi:exodeoxyribonuclease III [Sesbania bispinosa]|nr:exodeoxyribonuclease III [Sesbania bispinosa]
MAAKNIEGNGDAGVNSEDGLRMLPYWMPRWGVKGGGGNEKKPEILCGEMMGMG